MTTPQERQDILRHARATLAGEIDGDGQATRQREIAAEGPDPLAQWCALRKARQESEPEPPAAAAPAPVDWSAWQAWLDSHVKAAIEKECAEMLTAVGEFVGEFIGETQREAAAEMTTKVRALNLEIGELRLELREAKLAAKQAAKPAD